jgi:uncharacterized protein (DUF1015 family)
MAKIFPFKGILYNRDRIADVSKVTAPPYDVISEEEQDKYYGADEYNIIRLILGREHPDDNEQNNRYTRAAGFLQSWLDESIFLRDNKPSIYFYSQEYDMEGKRKLQKGFVCILRLEEFSKGGTVLPHEKTLAGAKKDRSELIDTCQANLSPIFGLYPDPGFHLSKFLDERMTGEPTIDIRDDNEPVHKLWRVSDSEIVQRIHGQQEPDHPAGAPPGSAFFQRKSGRMGKTAGGILLQKDLFLFRRTISPDERISRQRNRFRHV